ncbi:DUF4349 domain-containing protein [Streptomyces sp. NPDC048606]|uniref:DUF4349 domain-containing protein n=1 Tax=Streptomyces sp. NPDC048606 TaxID=3154726 RepID=UPI00343616B1
MHAFHRRRSTAGLAALALAGVLAVTGCGADGATSASDKAAVAPRGEAAGPAAKPGAGAAEGAAKPGAAEAAPPGAAPSAAADAKAGQQPVAVRPHVIRTGSLSIETTEPQKVLAAARRAAEDAGGYVGNESTERGEGGRMGSTLTLRVPGERFDAVIAALEGGGKLLNRKVEAEDVTERVADVDSRVRSQQASVARVRDMMEKASGLSDVVMLESELSRRQADLESLLAQQAALKDRTAMGTITLSVSEPAPEPQEKKEEKEKEPGLGDALSGGWSVFATLVRYLLLALAAVAPFALTAVLVLLGLRTYRRLRPAAPGKGRGPVRVPRQAGPAAPPADTPSAAPAPAPAAAPADAPSAAPAGGAGDGEG